MNETAGTMEQDTIMTIAEVAEYLKMAPSTVYRLARQGEVPGRKIGGAWRFSRRVIDAWIKMQQSSPALVPAFQTTHAATAQDADPELSSPESPAADTD